MSLFNFLKTLRYYTPVIYTSLLFEIYIANFICYFRAGKTLFMSRRSMDQLPFAEATPEALSEGPTEEKEKTDNM